VLFSVPSTAHRLELLALRMAIVGRNLVRRGKSFYWSHFVLLSALAVCVIVVLLAIRYWHFWVWIIPAKLSALARVILVFVQAHPRIAHRFHVLVNMVPDIAYLLLAIAGVSYLMPELVDKIEKRKPIRVAVMTLFVCFGLLAILVNAINRTDQEEKESQLRSKLDVQGEKLDGQSAKIDGLRAQQNNTLTFLANSKGQPNEAERRLNILQTLRGRYVIDHPEVSVTMLTGDSWPPKEWMDKHLKELGETFPFIPPAQPVASKPQLPPPAIDVVAYVGNDTVEHTSFMIDPNRPFRWEDIEQSCVLPFRCYTERDLKNKAVEIDVGTKGWARIIFSIFNIGGSVLIHPSLSVNVALGHDVALARYNQRQPLTPTNGTNSMIELKPPEALDLVPIDQSHTPADIAIDVTVGPSVTDFLLGFKLYGDNMSVHFVVVPVHVIRTGS
jgi:hypothetical protein